MSDCFIASANPNTKRLSAQRRDAVRRLDGRAASPDKGYGFARLRRNDIPTLENIFREIVRIDGGEDGLEFIADSIKGAEIRAEKITRAFESRCSHLSTARKFLCKLTSVSATRLRRRLKPETLRTILDLPKPRLKIYPKETVIAEKFEAMVKLGIGNSRMKDFWDVQFLIKNSTLTARCCKKPIRATFAARQTGVPQNLPTALTELSPQILRPSPTGRRSSARQDYVGYRFLAVLESLRGFFAPLIAAEARNANFAMTWAAQEGWKK